MKKQILAIAIAAGFAAAPILAQAGESKVYGRVHVSLDSVESESTVDGKSDAELDLSDRKSAFGYKGSEDLGGGLTVFGKVEWSVNPTDSDTAGAIGTRDRFIGLKKAGMGSVKIGTASSNWKQTAAKMDPFWHTVAEGRNIGSASSLSNSMGDDSGRMTDMIQFSSAPMGGMNVVLNIQENGTGEMTTGFGVRYKAKGLYVFADMLKLENDVDLDGLTDQRGYIADTATKFGGMYTMGGLTLGLTLEMTEDVVMADYTTLMAKYKVNSNDTVAFTYGEVTGLTTAQDHTAFSLGYMHSMSKRTGAYVAYIDRSMDSLPNSAIAAAAASAVAPGIRNLPTSDISGFSFGLKHSF